MTLSQLDLFPTPQLPARRNRRDELLELAFSPEVKDALADVARSRIGAWLGWDAFKAVRERYDIGFCMGHVLFALVREGRLLEKKIYLGKGLEADRPGSRDYQGYYCQWSAV
jgi:hypothetical protein